MNEVTISVIVYPPFFFTGRMYSTRDKNRFIIVLVFLFVYFLFI
jgi:hypothetical protein